MINADELVEQMSDDMGMLPIHIQHIIRTAPLRYKVFEIPKKSGGKREVAQPAREVKVIQRWLIKALESKLPIHKAATAYKNGASIRENAIRHLGSNYLLKLDFRNFFPSIAINDIVDHLLIYCPEEFDRSAAQLIARACTWARKRQPPLRLCIGAPSSPLLSNSIMYAFDVSVFRLAEKATITYSRYADDLFFSCKEPNVLEPFAKGVQKEVSNLEYPQLTLNHGKTVFASRAGRRVVAGITLTPTDSLSIGRERKRLIRAMNHRARRGLLDPDELQRLVGLISFADCIEPGFSKRLA